MCNSIWQQFLDYVQSTPEEVMKNFNWDEEKNIQLIKNSEVGSILMIPLSVNTSSS